MDYQPNMMSGTCRNGAERDKGRVIHAVPGQPVNGFDGRTALCGKRPGLRSSGWSNHLSPDAAITCPACLKKLIK